MAQATGTARTALRLALATMAAGIALLLVSDVAPLAVRLAEGAAEQQGESGFYDHAGLLEAEPPGTLVRSEPLASVPEGMRGWRILYHSTDLDGEDILVSGVVAAPESATPRGGRTIVSWGHPTTGTAARCAPSAGFDPFDSIEGLRDLVHAGYVVAASDYSGMGAAGPASFLIGETEGRNVLDAARAARQLSLSGASERVALWGHSQGGHAALFAAEIAADYAPELQVGAAAVAAPATELGALLTADIVDISGVSIGSYAFDAYVSAYGEGDSTVRLESILTPQGVQATPKMAALCLLGQNAALHALAKPLIGAYLSHDPSTTEPWATLLKQNTPGQRGALAIPLFVAQGTDDTLVKPELTQEFVAAQQRAGAKVAFYPIEKTGHALVALKAMPMLMPWLKENAPPTMPAS